MRTLPPLVNFRAQDAVGGVLRAYRRDSAPWPYHARAMHGHRFFVLNYYDRGVGQIRFPRGSLQVEPGQVVLAVPGELHDTSGIARMGGWVVEFTGDVLGPQTAGPSLVLPRTDGTPWFVFAGRRFGNPAHASVPTAERGAWDQRFARLDQEVKSQALGSREVIRALMQLLLIDLARQLPPLGGGRVPSATPLVAEVFSVIENRHAEHRLSLAGIARAVGRSQSHVTAVLRAETGMTVLQWLTERRMAEARRRLQETDEDIGIIGERVGYIDRAYFARRFRQSNGMSARAYRQAFR